MEGEDQERFGVNSQIKRAFGAGDLLKICRGDEAHCGSVKERMRGAVDPTATFCCHEVKHYQIQTQGSCQG